MNEEGEVVEIDTKEDNLSRLPYGDQDIRTEEEIQAGMPKFINNGLLAVDLDRQAVADLLKGEGLTPLQISQIRVEFSAAWITDVDYSGNKKLGYSVDNSVVVFTTVPFELHEGVKPPEPGQVRIGAFHQAIPAEEVIDTMLHELKHQVQGFKGIWVPASWAAKSREEHDELPTEQEAIAFAASKTPEFIDKLKLTDVGEHFKPVSEFVGGRENVYTTGLISSAKVTHFFNDSLDNEQTNEFLRKFNVQISEGGMNNRDLETMFNSGRQLVNQKAISVYEYNFLVEKVIDKFLKEGNINQAAVAYGFFINAEI